MILEVNPNQRKLNEITGVLPEGGTTNRPTVLHLFSER
jgi:hypothetical protein